MKDNLNEHGVVTNPVTVLDYEDKYVKYSIRKGVIDNKEYFASSVTVSGFGVFSGSSGPVSRYCKKTYDECLDYIKAFLKREFDSEQALKHISKLEIFQEVQQLKLF